MKKKMNYLVSLLMIILMVGCTKAENLTITNTEDAQQEVTTQTIVDEPVAEETPAQSKIVNQL